MKLDVTPSVPFRLVRVRFQSEIKTNERVYAYKTRINFAAGDLAVVEVNAIFKVVDVMEVIEGGAAIIEARRCEKSLGRELKWIVDKVDPTEYMDRIKAEQSIAAEMEELSELAQARHVMQKAQEVFCNDPELLRRFNELIALKASL